VKLSTILIFLCIAGLVMGFQWLNNRPGTNESVDSRKEVDNDIPWPFYAKKVLTQPEQVLYFRLAEALPDFLIFSQVQLSRFLGVKKGTNFQAWNNRINRMSVDFLVCRKDASVVVAIELDDSSHKSNDRKEADAKKDKAIGAAGLNVIRWHVKDIPSTESIISVLGEHIANQSI